MHGPSKAEAVSDPTQDVVEGAARELVVARLTRQRLARLRSAYRPNDFEAALRTQVWSGRYCRSGSPAGNARCRLPARSSSHRSTVQSLPMAHAGAFLLPATRRASSRRSLSCSNAICPPRSSAL